MAQTGIEELKKKAKTVRIMFRPVFKYSWAEVFFDPKTAENNDEYKKYMATLESKEQMIDGIAVEPLEDIRIISERYVMVITSGFIYNIMSERGNVASETMAAIDAFMAGEGDILDLSMVSSLKTKRIRVFDETDVKMIKAARDPVAAEFDMYSIRDLIALADMFLYTSYIPEINGTIVYHVRRIAFIVERVDASFLHPFFLEIMWDEVNSYLAEKGRELSSIALQRSSPTKSVRSRCFS